MAITLAAGSRSLRSGPPFHRDPGVVTRYSCEAARVPH